MSRLYKRLIGRDVYSFTCLCRAYRRDVLGRVRFRANGFAAVVEIMLRATLAGYRIDVVPMTLDRRQSGESELKIGDGIMTHVGLLTLTALTVSVQQVRHFLTRGGSGGGRIQGEGQNGTRWTPQ